MTHAAARAMIQETTMRYMMLIYSKEAPDGPSPEEAQQIRAAHGEVIEEATRKGVLRGAQPLAPTTTATTVRMQNGKALMRMDPSQRPKSSSPAITSSIARTSTRPSSGPPKSLPGAKAVKVVLRFGRCAACGHGPRLRQPQASLCLEWPTSAPLRYPSTARNLDGLARG